jgi:heme-degrading monooxygenase HmoA
MFCSVSTIHCPVSKQQEYFELRRREIEPAMTSAKGFIRRELLVSRTNPEKYLLIVYWETTECAQAYRDSRVHDDVRLKTIALIGARPATEDYDFAGGDGTRASE